MKKYIVPEEMCIEIGEQTEFLDLSQQAVEDDDEKGYIRNPVDVYNSEEDYNKNIDVWNNWGAD
ncbi:MAG: hypothetical protein KBT12_07560 [Bacteroidales bacterium]|nr:hypothetical protein [Candidatus Physcousia equi]